MLSFLLNFFISFLKLVKRISHCLLHSKQNHAFNPIYHSLKIENISSSYAYDFEQDLLFEPHEIKKQPCEPHDTKVDTISSSHSHVSFKIPNWYRPLHLPPILHDFTTKHYKYLPKFDGESEYLIAKKHLQKFWTFSHPFWDRTRWCFYEGLLPILARRC